MTITSETASLIGEDFFSGLLRNLAEGNRASCALIATINETEKTASTIAVYSDGAIVGGIEYPLADTPCENLLSSSECFYKSDVKNLFPKDLMLQEMGAEFYAGSSLVGSGGELLGIMVLIGDAPIEEDDVELIRSLFSFVTGRVTAELERQSSLDKYTKALRNTVQALVLALEQRDSYTAGHQRNVASISCEIAGEMGLSAEQIDALSLAASIHDIGKISIPAEILNRAGRLSDIELELVKTHSQNGYDILKDIELPWDIAEVVLQHHERIDGSGYPGGLKADQIHLGARIIAVADVVDAMTTHRPYRAGLGLKKAEQEIERGRGTLYDEEVVAAYFRSRAS
jgi:HD-GYP domain-containing protein (c-di-GMP phosphodiesterase class II)